jgi:NadR type nicotinamide-nucleotide adenylyltransferase
VEEVAPGKGGVKRIVVTGSESTGKTELAKRLALHYNAELVPEFVREFAAAKEGGISFSDHGPIARGQMELEDRIRSIAEARNALIVQDTDLLSTVVYCDHYFGACPQWIAEVARERKPDLYLLADIDVPWIPDGIRDRGHLREEVQALFAEAVRSSGAPWVSITGSWDERWNLAVAAIDAALL